jgi:hypothetical protein
MNMRLRYYLTKVDTIYIQTFNEANKRTCSDEAPNVEYDMNKAYIQHWLLYSDDTVKWVYVLVNESR